MKSAISPAYWPLRILLSIGIASVTVILLWGVVTPISGPMFGPSEMGLGPLSLNGPLVWRMLVVGVPIVGLVVQIRTFRALRDEAPPWRYRDRNFMGAELGAYGVALVVLALGVGLTLLVVGFVLLGPPSQPCFGCDDPAVLGLPASVVIDVVAIGLALVGTLWMTGIFLRMP